MTLTFEETRPVVLVEAPTVWISVFSTEAALSLSRIFCKLNSTMKDSGKSLPQCDVRTPRRTLARATRCHHC